MGVALIGMGKKLNIKSKVESEKTMRTKRMQKKWAVIAVVIALLLVAILGVGPMMSNVEHPEYKIIESIDDIEIREYNTMVIAEVRVSGQRSDSISWGFRLLAGYIFGNNKQNQKIAMTAPVQQEYVDGLWKISFVMPAEYSIDNLPEPQNKDVFLAEVPHKKYGVIRFKGSNASENIEQNEKRLKFYIRENGIKTIGSPKYAFYNPPWTLPFLRRNEIMIEIDG